MTKLVFLPGASGSQHFWQPLRAALTEYTDQQVIAYPGFDSIVPNLATQKLYDLQEFVKEKIEDDSILIAQSMGGVLAVGLALKHPQKVKGLVLLATSGGLDLKTFHCADWRTDYRELFKTMPDWFEQDQTEFSRVQLASLDVPILLIWGDHDPLSTVQLGQYLAGIFKNAKLHIIQGGDHFFANTHADQVAMLIQDYLEQL
ncbi:alpha/beta hydrolase [Acinetobacter lwoffii]|uniref:alpha/beta fold hydrolase n=1 Tax=Acinetobacter TaxID=469 RepID=UPI0013DF36EE|nr:alpha/beta hydrolase [Acinetobacter lwoffii]MDP1317745.1 alpha/beta hydrolase [Acinetobacter lwoffii]NGP42323.1 alpha/beta hydrolase [Acinetobacter lwoffii]